MPENDPEYVLIHKRALIAMSHCMGLALKSYATCSKFNLAEITKDLSDYANTLASRLSKNNLDYVIKRLVEHQSEGSVVIKLEDLLDNENTN